MPGNVLAFRDEKNNAIIILYSKERYRIASEIEKNIKTELNKAETIKDLRIQLLSTQQTLYILAQKTTPEAKHKDDKNTYENLVGDLPETCFGSLTPQLLKAYQLLAKDLIDQDKIPKTINSFGSLFYPESMKNFMDYSLPDEEAGVFILALRYDIKYLDSEHIATRRVKHEVDRTRRWSCICRSPDSEENTGQDHII